MRMEAVTGGMWSLAKDRLQPPEDEEAGRIPPWSLRREHGPAPTLTADSCLPDL